MVSGNKRISSVDEILSNAFILDERDYELTEESGRSIRLRKGDEGEQANGITYQDRRPALYARRGEFTESRTSYTVNRQPVNLTTAEVCLPGVILRQML